MSNDPIIKEALIDAPASKIWSALTDNVEMKKWYFDISEFKPEKGFEFHFYGGSEKMQYHHICKITEVLPDRKISYTWRYEIFPVTTHVAFELVRDGNKTLVKLTHEGVDNFPPGNPDFVRSSFEQGWEYIIGTSLKNYIEGNKIV